MSKITVIVQHGQWPSPKDTAITLPLDDFAREALVPLDFPSASSGIFCTPPATARRVIQWRKVAAEEITRAVMVALRERDTYDGTVPVNTVHGREISP